MTSVNIFLFWCGAAEKLTTVFSTDGDGGGGGGGGEPPCLTAECEAVGNHFERVTKVAGLDLEWFEGEDAGRLKAVIQKLQVLQLVKVNDKSTWCVAGCPDLTVKFDLASEHPCSQKTFFSIMVGSLQLLAALEQQTARSFLWLLEVAQARTCQALSAPSADDSSIIGVLWVDSKKLDRKLKDYRHSVLLCLQEVSSVSMLFATCLCSLLRFGCRALCDVSNVAHA